MKQTSFFDRTVLVAGASLVIALGVSLSAQSPLRGQIMPGMGGSQAGGMSGGIPKYCTSDVQCNVSAGEKCDLSKNQCVTGGSTGGTGGSGGSCSDTSYTCGNPNSQNCSGGGDFKFESSCQNGMCYKCSGGGSNSNSQIPTEPFATTFCTNLYTDLNLRKIQTLSKAGNGKGYLQTKTTAGTRLIYELDGSTYNPTLSIAGNQITWPTDGTIVDTSQNPSNATIDGHQALQINKAKDAAGNVIFSVYQQKYNDITKQKDVVVVKDTNSPTGYSLVDFEQLLKDLPFVPKVIRARDITGDGTIALLTVRAAYTNNGATPVAGFILWNTQDDTVVVVGNKVYDTNGIDRVIADIDNTSGKVLVGFAGVKNIANGTQTSYKTSHVYYTFDKDDRTEIAECH